MHKDQNDEKRQASAALQPQISVQDGHYDVLNADTAFTAAQHALSVKDGFRLYAPAIGWAFLFSLGVIMAGMSTFVLLRQDSKTNSSLGFDPQLVGTLIAIPQFQKDFGQPYDGGYLVSAPWQSAFNLGVPVGQVVGSFGVGYPLERIGRRWTLAICCIISVIAVAIQFSAQNRPQILVAELVNGVVLGAYPVIAPTYISEVTPVVLRGIGAAFVNLSFVIGQLVASGVLAGTESRQDRWSYDIPFACQWIFPIAILVALPFSPESPWWLVRRGEMEKAERALVRLTHSSVDHAAILANIKLTTELEIAESSAAVGFSECFKGTDLRRTIISTMVYAIQPLVANFLVIGYAVYFFELAGLPIASSFNLGVGLLALGFVGTILSWPLMAYAGRRPIYNWGLVLLVVVVLLIGLLDVAPSYNTNSSFAWAQSVLMCVYNFFYDLTIGPLCFVILCETSSAKLRGKTIAFSTAINALINIACAVGIPYALNPNQGNLRGKLAFVFLGTTIPCVIWCFLALPETKGRTFEELDLMFQRRVPTKRFKKYVLEDEADVKATE